MVALKMLNETLDIIENKFNEEVGCLVKKKHKNAVWFLGFDTTGIIVDYEGKFVMTNVFPYLPNGCPHNYTTEMSMWPTTCLYIFTFLLKKIYGQPPIILLIVLTLSEEVFWILLNLLSSHLVTGASCIFELL